jgi:hypothetical protein
MNKHFLLAAALLLSFSFAQSTFKFIKNMKLYLLYLGIQDFVNQLMALVIRKKQICGISNHLLTQSKLHYSWILAFD